MSRTNKGKYRYFLDDEFLHPMQKNPLTGRLQSAPWFIRDRENGKEIVETCETREVARERLAVLNGRVMLVAEAGIGSASKIREIRRL